MYLVSAKNAITNKAKEQWIEWHLDVLASNGIKEYWGLENDMSHRLH